MGIAKFLPCVLTALRVKCLRDPERLILERKAIVVPPREKPGERLPNDESLTAPLDPLTPRRGRVSVSTVGNK